MIRNISPTNIIYILAYAFDLKWEYLEDEVKNADLSDSSLFELLVFVLTRWTSELLKYGLYRKFLDITEDTKRLKGKICFKPLIKTQCLRHGRIFCQYDDLSFDILENQILLSTLRYCNYELYSRVNNSFPYEEKKKKNLEILNLEVTNQARLISSQVNFHKIDKKLFDQLVFHKMNIKYKPILYLCKIIYDSGLLYHRGEKKFIDIPEKRLNQIFERFLRNFLSEKLKYKGYKITDKSFESNTWLSREDQNNVNYMPAIHPDIVIWEKGDPKFVIDAKFYEKPLYVANLYGQNEDGEEENDVYKTRSHNLYQIMAYSQFLNCSGLLVYAQTQIGAFEEMVYLNPKYYDEEEKQKSEKKQFGFCTLDLSGDFEEFKGRMDSFVQRVTELIK